MNLPRPGRLRRLQLRLTSSATAAYCRRPRTRYVLSWTLALALLVAHLVGAGIAFRNPARTDGNGGHATIDFVGQWLLGRLLVAEHGRHLYHRTVQREVLAAAYPDADGVPPEARKENDDSDVNNIMGWMMDLSEPARLGGPVAPLAADGPLAAAVLSVAVVDKSEPRELQAAVSPRGGPLYPPVQALVTAPFGALSPRVAYRVYQIAIVGQALLAAWAIVRLSAGRVWYPLALAAVLVTPGYLGSLQLAQNAALSLLLLLWGWYFLTRDRPWLGGALWGCLAFKPVWAVAFLPVLLLAGRLRATVAMGLTGAAFIVATLPLVGVEPWLDWLQLGRRAAALYEIDENWVHLSRDLHNLPPRFYHDFQHTYLADREAARRVPSAIGWGLVLAVAAVTVAVRLRRRGPVVDGPPAAFLLLAGWLTGYHFMYYDVLLAGLPLCLLCTHPSDYLRGRTRTVGGRVWTVNEVVPTLAVLLSILGHLVPVTLGYLTKLPPDTPVLVLLWFWCGWRTWRDDWHPASASVS